MKNRPREKRSSRTANSAIGEEAVVAEVPFAENRVGQRVISQSWQNVIDNRIVTLQLLC
jgi:hypothetical protein